MAAGGQFERAGQSERDAGAEATPPGKTTQVRRRANGTVGQLGAFAREWLEVGRCVCLGDD